MQKEPVGRNPPMRYYPEVQANLKVVQPCLDAWLQKCYLPVLYLSKFSSHELMMNFTVGEGVWKTKQFHWLAYVTSKLFRHGVEVPWVFLCDRVSLSLRYDINMRNICEDSKISPGLPTIPRGVKCVK